MHFFSLAYPRRTLIAAALIFSICVGPSSAMPSGQTQAVGCDAGLRSAASLPLAPGRRAQFLAECVQARAKSATTARRSATSSRAETESVLYTFAGGADGQYPNGGLIAVDGKLYGTTFWGGGSPNCSYGCGTVFEATPPTSKNRLWTERPVYVFAGGADGAYPFSRLIGAGGALYGTTGQGGSSSNCYGGCGTVFRLTPPLRGGTKWTESVIYTFGGGADGAEPDSLVLLDGALYGAAGGGVDGGFGGSIFKLTPPAWGHTGWTENTLLTFTGGVGGASPTIIAAGGALYGTAFYGGNPAACSVDTFGDGSCGLVFKLVPTNLGKTAWNESILYAFSGPDGAGPSSIIAAGGALYGTTQYGGLTSNCEPVFTPLGCGTVFRLLPPVAGQTAWKETVLYAFTDTTDGAYPEGVMANRCGALFGAAGDGSPSSGGGVVFALTPPPRGGNPWIESVLHAFPSSPADGSGPNAGFVEDSSGALYGTTAYGGALLSGTLFELTVARR